MRTRKLPKHFATGSIYFAISFLLSVSLGHHIVDIFEKNLFVTIVFFLLSVPFLFVVLYRTIPHANETINRFIRLEHISVLLAFSILASIFFTNYFYSLPGTANTLVIAPELNQDQYFELLEVKAGGIRLNLKESAQKSNWIVNKNSIIASNTSRPLNLTFQSKINSELKLLFNQHLQGGRVKVSLGTQNEDIVNLGRADDLSEITLNVRYNNIPNWLFIPFLIFADLITFGIGFLAILLLQEHFMGVGARKKQKLTASVRFIPWILTIIAIVIHLLNSLAVPLVLGPDTPSYIQGALSWLENGNLDGHSSFRGFGLTILFTPIFALFGRNPWGMKLFLHAIAVACVPLSYRLGWQLSKNHWGALGCGLIALITPDLYFYSNYLMSDLPNLFFVLLFCTLFITALLTWEFKWIALSLFTGSFLTLIRSENIVVLLISVLFFGMPLVWGWLSDFLNKFPDKNKSKRLLHQMSRLGLLLLLSISPILWWANHNYKIHGFFGLSDYAGEVFYDGWVYYGDASKLSFSDLESPAIQEINAVIETYPIQVTDATGTPTGWEIYPSLIKAGYSTEEAFKLLESAAWDSINNNLPLTGKLLGIKIRDALEPASVSFIRTFPLPDEDYYAGEFKIKYFDTENSNYFSLIKIQREINNLTSKYYSRIYPGWVWFCILLLFISLLRRPRDVWLAITTITISRIFVPNIFGISIWRYTLAAILPLQIIAIAWIMLILGGVRYHWIAWFVHKNSEKQIKNTNA